MRHNRPRTHPIALPRNARAPLRFGVVAVDDTDDEEAIDDDAFAKSSDELLSVVAPSVSAIVDARQGLAT